MDDELETAMRADPLLKKIGERDLKLAELSVLMSRIIAAQFMLRRAKQSGQDIPELDSWILQMQEGSDRVVAAMNKRMKELPPLHLDEEIP
jgi:hypothetical protein